MANRIKDITNVKFGRLTPYERVGLDKHGNTLWKCKCDCGNERVVYLHNLKIGKTLSCGCYHKEIKTTHGHSHSGKRKSTKTYNTWRAMLKRCYDTKDKYYKYYGGRGIIICDRWKECFENLLEDMGERPEGMTIDRIDNNKNYEPGNCRWATPYQQTHNRNKKEDV